MALLRRPSPLLLHSLPISLQHISLGAKVLINGKPQGVLDAARRSPAGLCTLAHGPASLGLVGRGLADLGGFKIVTIPSHARDTYVIVPARILSGLLHQRSDASGWAVSSEISPRGSSILRQIN